MTEEELRGHAARILAEILNVNVAHAEFCYVYEDEELEDADDDDLRTIHDLIRGAIVEASL